MQDRVDGAVKMSLGEQFDELLLVEIVGDFAIDEVAKLVSALQVVDGDDVVDAALVEAFDDIGADKAAGAGDDGIHTH